MYLLHRVNPKLTLSGLQAYLYVAVSDGPCVCSDILRECGISHDELLQLTKSFQRSAKTGPVDGYDLLVIKPHPNDKRKRVAELSERGQEVRDAMVEKFIGPRGHPLA
jgi:hypothetical protein